MGLPCSVIWVKRECTSAFSKVSSFWNRCISCSISSKKSKSLEFSLSRAFSCHKIYQITCIINNILMSTIICTSGSSWTWKRNVTISRWIGWFEKSKTECPLWWMYSKIAHSKARIRLENLLPGYIDYSIFLSHCNLSETSLSMWIGLQWILSYNYTITASPILRYPYSIVKKVLSLWNKPYIYRTYTNTYR